MVNGLQKLSETEQTDGCLVDGHFARVRTPTQRTPEKIAEVSDIIRSNPSASTRKVAQEASVSHTVAWKILREDLEVFPYKIQLSRCLLILQQEDTSSQMSSLNGSKRKKSIKKDLV